MKKNALITLVLLSTILRTAVAQTSDCNKLGAWLWYIEITGFQTHGQIADSLKSLGVKRIYVKVADGAPNATVWPELYDTAVVAAYHARGLEVWGWSYNYTSNPTGQAAAIYQAAKTGYDGYVVDVETEFDGKTTELSNLFTAFATKKQQAVTDGFADASFKLYCTTWGNPMDHNFHLELINPYVDGFMPQTYVEIWGPSYVQNLTYWIGVGNQEYTALGATKPIHHIAALETGGMTAAQLDAYIVASGPETSLWRIPGGAVAQSRWQIWHNVDWNRDFCLPSGTQALENLALRVSPNPTNGLVQVQWTGESGQLCVFDMGGRLCWQSSLHTGETTCSCDLSAFPAGVYVLRIMTADKVYQSRVVKNAF